MPVKPIQWVRFEQGHVYPHMAKHDARIWERFITRYDGYFFEAAYDIAVGGSETTDPQATDSERLMWRFNTAKRIDAAVRNRDEIWLVEVRPSAGLAAVGAVLGYTFLSELDKWADRPIVMTIATDRTDNDIRLVCESFDIQLIELPEPDETEPTKEA
jgi:hypothetical protein